MDGPFALWPRPSRAMLLTYINHDTWNSKARDVALSINYYTTQSWSYHVLWVQYSIISLLHRNWHSPQSAISKHRNALFPFHTVDMIIYPWRANPSIGYHNCGDKILVVDNNPRTTLTMASTHPVGSQFHYHLDTPPNYTRKLSESHWIRTLRYDSYWQNMILGVQTV